MPSILIIPALKCVCILIVQGNCEMRVPPSTYVHIRLHTYVHMYFHKVGVLQWIGVIVSNIVEN